MNLDNFIVNIVPPFIVLVIFVLIVMAFAGWAFTRLCRVVGFLLWIVFSPLRLLLGTLGGSPGSARRFAYAAPMPQGRFIPPLNMTMADGTRRCGVPGCRHVNPVTARYCRHCGQQFSMR